MCMSMDVNRSEFLAEFSPRFNWLLIQSKENLDHFGLGLGKQGRNNVF